MQPALHGLQMIKDNRWSTCNKVESPNCPPCTNAAALVEPILMAALQQSGERAKALEAPRSHSPLHHNDHIDPGVHLRNHLSVGEPRQCLSNRTPSPRSGPGHPAGAWKSVLWKSLSKKVFKIIRWLAERQMQLCVRHFPSGIALQRSHVLGSAERLSAIQLFQWQLTAGTDKSLQTILQLEMLSPEPRSIAGESDWAGGLIDKNSFIHFLKNSFNL